MIITIYKSQHSQKANYQKSLQVTVCLGLSSPVYSVKNCEKWIFKIFETRGS